MEDKTLNGLKNVIQSLRAQHHIETPEQPLPTSEPAFIEDALKELRKPKVQIGFENPGETAARLLREAATALDQESPAIRSMAEDIGIPVLALLGAALMAVVVSRGATRAGVE
jgi:hypothetical protein